MRITRRQLRRIIRSGARLNEGMRYNPQLLGGSDDDPEIAVYNKTAPFIYDLLQDEMALPDSEFSPMDDPKVLQPTVRALRQLADDLEQRGRKNQRW